MTTPYNFLNNSQMHNERKDNNNPAVSSYYGNSPYGYSQDVPQVAFTEPRGNAFSLYQDRANESTVSPTASSQTMTQRNYQFIDNRTNPDQFPTMRQANEQTYYYGNTAGSSNTTRQPVSSLYQQNVSKQGSLQEYQQQHQQQQQQIWQQPQNGQQQQQNGQQQQQNGQQQQQNGQQQQQNGQQQQLYGQQHQQLRQQENNQLQAGNPPHPDYQKKFNDSKQYTPHQNQQQSIYHSAYPKSTMSITSQNASWERFDNAAASNSPGFQAQPRAELNRFSSPLSSEPRQVQKADNSTVTRGFDPSLQSRMVQGTARLNGVGSPNDASFSRNRLSAGERRTNEPAGWPNERPLTEHRIDYGMKPTVVYCQAQNLPNQNMNLESQNSSQQVQTGGQNNAYTNSQGPALTPKANIVGQTPAMLGLQYAVQTQNTGYSVPPASIVSTGVGSLLPETSHQYQRPMQTIPMQLSQVPSNDANSQVIAPHSQRPFHDVRGSSGMLVGPVSSSTTTTVYPSLAGQVQGHSTSFAQPLVRQNNPNHWVNFGNQGFIPTDAQKKTGLPNHSSSNAGSFYEQRIDPSQLRQRTGSDSNYSPFNSQPAEGCLPQEMNPTFNKQQGNPELIHRMNNLNIRYPPPDDRRFLVQNSPTQNPLQDGRRNFFPNNNSQDKQTDKQIFAGSILASGTSNVDSHQQIRHPFEARGSIGGSVGWDQSNASQFQGQRHSYPDGRTPNMPYYSENRPLNPESRPLYVDGRNFEQLSGKQVPGHQIRQENQPNFSTSIRRANSIEAPVSVQGMQKTQEQVCNPQYQVRNYTINSSASYTGRATHPNQDMEGRLPVGPNQQPISQTPFNQSQFNQGQLNQSQLNQSQFNQSQFNQSQLNQSQFNQGQFNQGQLNQSQFNQSQLNQSQLNQSQFNQSQLNQGQLNQSQLNQSQFNQSQFNQGQLNQGEFNQSQFNQSHLNQSQLNQGQLNQGQLNQGQLNQGQFNQGQFNQGQFSQGSYVPAQYNPTMNHLPASSNGQPIVIMPGYSSSNNRPMKFEPRIESILEHISSKHGQMYDKLRKILAEIFNVQDDVMSFKGRRGDQSYILIEELLTRQLLALDGVHSDGSEEVRLVRKTIVRQVQGLISMLESKAKT